jgi:putative SOS response-associated peptidase YedK
MCTRYFVELSPELRPIIEAARRSPLAGKMVHHLGRPVAREGEVRPTDISAVIATSSRGTPGYFPMVWGFTSPATGAPLVNCRVETAGSKPMWKESWQRRRCIVPASWYYEWEHFVSPSGVKKTGDKYAIQPAGSAVTWLAGLYRLEDGYPHFTVLTRTPSTELSRIHDRMPVILPYDSIQTWIDPAASAETVKALADSALTEMIFEKV